MRTIIFNITTTTYETAKYLNNLLTPLTQLEYNILNRQDLMRGLIEEPILAGYKMISFNVKSLFTDLPLYENINLFLGKVYNKIKIQTLIYKTVKYYYIFALNSYISLSVTTSIYKVMQLQWNLC